MTHEEALALLEECGAVLTGHFRLTSGRHSDVYVQKARILEQPRPTMALAAEMASWYPRVDVVVAPAVGAVVLGFAVALQAGARAIFAEREGERMRLRRGFAIQPGERVLVVEDVITTGGSAGQVYELAREHGGDVVGVSALVDRSTQDVGFPLRAVLRIDAVSWLAEECPLCREGAPIDVPGSRHLQGTA
jgi:orotate phosphoribosyltransferase